jgi:7-carboxy-7-deazaguanine synthase
MSIDRILAEIAKHPAAHVVLTGGEPMVARGIHELAARLRTAGKHITIETAGTVAPSGIACDLASISPKLADSIPPPDSIEPVWIDRHEKSRRCPEILRTWLAAYPFQLKFVFSSQADVAEIESLLADVGLTIPPSKILLMPEGTDPARIDSRCAELVDFCLKKGFRLCDRLHIRLFGNTRGT